MLQVTPPYIALGALLLVALTIGVIARRRSARVGLGDGGDPVLQRRCRAHGNAAETLPIGLLMLIALELCGTPAHWLHAFGLTLLGGRGLHAWGLLGSAGVSPGRFIGTLLTLLCLLAMAALLLWHGVVG